MIDVVIVGSGPAGLAAAIELRRQGAAQVVVLERETVAGGIPRHCAHPPYGLREFGRIMTGPTYARALVARAQCVGVDIRTRHSVVRLQPNGKLNVATPDGRQEIVARRVMVATGVRETPRSARLLSGDRPLGVLNTGALQSYVHLQGLRPFSRPVIVGTELVSLSAIMTCRSHGIRPVAVIEERDRATARWPLNLFPKLLGIPVFYDSQIAAIHGEARVSSVAIRRADGSSTMVDCDGVLLTGRFIPEASLVRASHLAFDDGSQGPVIDQFGRCSDQTYFAIGNILRPVETAGWSYREGRRIARYVVEDLRQGLAVPAQFTSIRRGAGVKLVIPQRISHPAALAGTKWLELRVEAPVSGRLSVSAGGTVIWAKSLSALPERRLMIPLKSIMAAQGAPQLTVEFTS